MVKYVWKRWLLPTYYYRFHNLYKTSQSGDSVKRYCNLKTNSVVMSYPPLSHCETTIREKIMDVPSNIVYWLTTSKVTFTCLALTCKENNTKTTLKPLVSYLYSLSLIWLKQPGLHRLLLISRRQHTISHRILCLTEFMIKALAAAIP